jgi:predicted transposase YbfD/YdcC
MQVGFPHIQTVVKIWRESTAYKTDDQQWLELIRGHWGGVEIRNHWKKDAILFEDKTRSRNPTLVGTLAMLRNTLLFMHKEQEEHKTLPGFIEAIAANSNNAFAMLTRRY